MTNRRVRLSVYIYTHRWENEVDVLRKVLEASGIQPSPDLTVEGGYIEVNVDGEIQDWKIARALREASVQATLVVITSSAPIEAPPTTPEKAWWHTLSRGSKIATTAVDVRIYLSAAGDLVWERAALPVGHEMQFWGWEGSRAKVLEPTRSYPDGLWVNLLEVSPKSAA